jgi:hypothetical protein
MGLLTTAHAAHLLEVWQQNVCLCLCVHMCAHMYRCEYRQRAASLTWARCRSIVVIINRVHSRSFFDGAVVKVHVFIRRQLCSLRKERQENQDGERLRNKLAHLTIQVYTVPTSHPQPAPSLWMHVSSHLTQNTLATCTQSRANASISLCSLIQ